MRVLTSTTAAWFFSVKCFSKIMLCFSLALSINTVWVPTHSTWRAHTHTHTRHNRLHRVSVRFQTPQHQLSSTHLGEAHEHQQCEEVGALQSLRQLLNAMVSEGGDDCAPLGASIETVQNVCHRACPVQANATATKHPNSCLHIHKKQQQGKTNKLVSMSSWRHLCR